MILQTSFGKLTNRHKIIGLRIQVECCRILLVSRGTDVVILRETDSFGFAYLLPFPLINLFCTDLICIPSASNSYLSKKSFSKAIECLSSSASVFFKALLVLFINFFLFLEVFPISKTEFKGKSINNMSKNNKCLLKIKIPSIVILAGSDK